MSDPYRELIEQLREAVVQPSDGGEATRRRILRDLAPPTVRRRVAWKVLLVAATLSLSTAFALYVASSHEPDSGRAPYRTRQNRAEIGRQPPAPPAATAPVPTRTPDVLAPYASSGSDADGHARGASETADGSQNGARTQTAASAPSPRTRAQPALRRRAKPAAAEQVAPAPVYDARGQALYLEAHRLHFRGAPQRALEAWDAYLATNPGGPLRLEAEYNRAVVLARLGRNDEARRALEPFARGAHAGFRRADAQQLLLQLPP